MSPEAIKEEPLTTKSDSFSFGMILWELVAEQAPFMDKSTAVEIIRAVEKGDYPEIPDSCDPDFAKLIKDCWNNDPLKRPEFKEILDRLEAIKSKGNSETSESETSNNTTGT